MISKLCGNVEELMDWNSVRDDRARKCFNWAIYNNVRKIDKSYALTIYNTDSYTKYTVIK